MQWHPEVKHSDYGQVALENFLYNVAGLKPTWSTNNIIEEQVAKIREQVGSDRVICALSGGVDSSVAGSACAQGCWRPAHLLLHRPRSAP